MRGEITEDKDDCFCASPLSHPVFPHPLSGFFIPLDLSSAPTPITKKEKNGTAHGQKMAEVEREGVLRTKPIISMIAAECVGKHSQSTEQWVYKRNRQKESIY